MASLNKKDITSGGDHAAGGTGIALPSEAEWRARADRAIQLLDEWSADETGYDDETWPELKKALDENRLSSRKLFDAE